MHQLKAEGQLYLLVAQLGAVRPQPLRQLSTRSMIHILAIKTSRMPMPMLWAVMSPTGDAHLAAHQEPGSTAPPPPTDPSQHGGSAAGGHNGQPGRDGQGLRGGFRKQLSREPSMTETGVRHPLASLWRPKQNCHLLASTMTLPCSNI